MAKSTVPGKQISIFVSDDTVKRAEESRAAQKFPPSLSRLLSVCLSDGVDAVHGEMIAEAEAEAAEAAEAAKKAGAKKA